MLGLRPAPPIHRVNAVSDQGLLAREVDQTTVGARVLPVIAELCRRRSARPERVPIGVVGHRRFGFAGCAREQPRRALLVVVQVEHRPSA